HAKQLGYAGPEGAADDGHGWNRRAVTTEPVKALPTMTPPRKGRRKRDPLIDAATDPSSNHHMPNHACAPHKHATKIPRLPCTPLPRRCLPSCLDGWMARWLPPDPIHPLL